MNDKCIVTLTIGKEFKRQWEKWCYQNWKEYADKHGYDLINISQPLDISERAQKRSAAWQKCLLLSSSICSHYRQVVWVDADILINTEVAPCICSLVPEDKIGGVDEYSYPNKELYLRMLKEKYDLWRRQGVTYINNLTPSLYYRRYGIETNINEVFHTGVFVASPKYHADIFINTYNNYEDKGGSEYNYEMRPLSYEIIHSGNVHWLPHEFNLCVSNYLNNHLKFLMNSHTNTNIILKKFVRKFGFSDYPNEKYCIQSAFQNSFFCHFAGMGFTKMKYVLPL